MPQRADDFEGVGAIGGNVDRRVGILHGPRRHRKGVRVVVLPFVGEFFVGPQAENYLQAFQEPVPGLLLVDTVAQEMGGDGASADAKDGTAAGQHVQGGRLLRQSNWVVKRHQVDGRTDPNPLGRLGDGRGDHQGRWHHRKALVEVQFGQPSRVEAQLVGKLALGNGVLVAGGRRLVRRTRQLEKQTKFHG